MFEPKCEGQTLISSEGPPSSDTCARHGVRAGAALSFEPGTMVTAQHALELGTCVRIYLYVYSRMSLPCIVSEGLPGWHTCELMVTLTCGRCANVLPVLLPRIKLNLTLMRNLSFKLM
jgi:hypothetical protein